MTTKTTLAGPEPENAAWQPHWLKIGLLISALLGGVGIARYVLALPWLVILILGVLALCVLLHLAVIAGRRSHRPGLKDRVVIEEHREGATTIATPINRQVAPRAVSASQLPPNTRRDKIQARNARAREYAKTHGCKSGKRGRSGGNHDCCA